VRYSSKHPEIDRSELIGPVGNMYWGVIEHYSMLALWEFVRNDPRFVVESLGYKLRAVVRVLRAAPWWIVGSLSVPQILLFVVLALCAVYGLATAPAHEGSSFRSYLVLLCLCMPASCLPNLVSVVGWELMADTITLWLLLMLVVLVYLASALVCSSSAAFLTSHALSLLAQLQRQLTPATLTDRRK
jgi:hypothetical protein